MDGRLARSRVTLIHLDTHADIFLPDSVPDELMSAADKERLARHLCARRVIGHIIH